MAGLTGVILVTGSASADSKTSWQSVTSVIGDSPIKLVDFKDEVNKLKKRFHKDNDKSSDNGNPAASVSVDEQTRSTTAQANCRPDIDVAIEVTRGKCEQPYKSSDFATRFINRTSKHAWVQIEFEAHSGGTGPLQTRTQMFEYRANLKETSYLCAMKARITKCTFD